MTKLQSIIVARKDHSLGGTWQKAKTAGQLSDYKHGTPLPDDVINAVTPIYIDLSDKRLLEKCLGDFTQNNNESFNSLLWRFASKTTSSGAVVVQIAAYLAVCIFNGGYMDVLKIMELMGIKIGQTAVQYRHREDESPNLRCRDPSAGSDA